jgi:alpha-beta hydrolase superfamily lysophospholipase
MPFEYEIHGTRKPIRLYRWDLGRLYRRDADGPRYQAVIVHGYREHAGRYEHVAQALIRHGAVVWAADYPGHGRSVGERPLIEDVDHLVADTERVVRYAGKVLPDLPLVLIGDSLGGVVATRFAQRHGDQVSALVLSGPAIGANPDVPGLVAFPDISIDPPWLSRDPEVTHEMFNEINREDVIADVTAFLDRVLNATPALSAA